LVDLEPKEWHDCLARRITSDNSALCLSLTSRLMFFVPSQSRFRQERLIHRLENCHDQVGHIDKRERTLVQDHEKFIGWQFLISHIVG
jgi:hypothetical protein